MEPKQDAPASSSGLGSHSSGRPESVPPSSHNPWEDVTYSGGEVTATQRAVAVTAPAPRPRDRASLTVLSGPHTGRVYSLATDVIIGRSLECDIRLDDPNVSRAHAQILVGTNGQCTLKDLGSRNGTFVNGFRQRECRLNTGDRIQLGTTFQMRFALYDEDEEGLLRRLYESSVRDTLTGIFNRHHFNERFESECSFALRHRTDVALLIVDIDHFKKVNDSYGHLAGDYVLKSIAGLMSHTIRTEDILCRYGGEELAVIARGIGVEGAVVLGERVRAVIQSSSFEYQGVDIRVTVSVGAATLTELPEPKKLPRELIALADERLYKAKAQGRNRVVGL